MNADDQGLIIALLHEISDLKARVAALQNFTVDLLAERAEDREEAFRKIEHTHSQIEANARRSTAIRIRKYCAGVDEETLKKWDLI